MILALLYYIRYHIVFRAWGSRGKVRERDPGTGSSALSRLRKQPHGQSPTHAKPERAPDASSRLFLRDLHLTTLSQRMLGGFWIEDVV